MAVCEHTKKFIFQYKTTPLETGIRNFNSIVKYFLYYAPGLDCIHAAPKIEDLQATEIFHRMIRRAGMEKRYYFYERMRKDHFLQFDLSGENLCFLCSRMVCQKMGKETELAALLRHIRNSFAHGLVYIWRDKRAKKDYILLEDIDGKTKRKTARIMVTSKILDDWKAILEGEIV